MWLHPPLERLVGQQSPWSKGVGVPARPPFLTSRAGFLTPTLRTRRCLGSGDRKRTPKRRRGWRARRGRGRRGCSRAAYLGPVAVAAVSRAASGVLGSRARPSARTHSPHAAPSGKARASGGGESGKGKVGGAEGAPRVPRELGGGQTCGAAAPRGPSRGGVIERGGPAGGLERRSVPRPTAGDGEEGAREERRLGGR